MAQKSAIASQQAQVTSEVRDMMVGRIVSMVRELTLENLVVAQYQIEALAHGTQATGAAPTGNVVKPLNGKANGASTTLTDTARELLGANPSGVDIETIAKTLYGSTDGDGRKKARSIMDFLRRKGEAKPKQGKWVLASRSDRKRILTPGSNGSLVVDVVKLSAEPLTRGQIVELVLKRDPNADRDSVSAAVSKQAQAGRIKAKAGLYTPGDVE